MQVIGKESGKGCFNITVIFIVAIIIIVSSISGGNKANIASAGIKRTV
ncbi:hypothetical protein [Metabacillus idriensis]|nr:hypothetical protein [Metabacillus idriensis]